MYAAVLLWSCAGSTLVLPRIGGRLAHSGRLLTRLRSLHSPNDSRGLPPCLLRVVVATSRLAPAA